MQTYAELGGTQTWYEERGSGEPVVLLHPGYTDARALKPNVDAIAATFRAFLPERRGHGRTPDVAGPITFAAMAEDTIAFLERVVGGPARLVGCSDGAVVALHVAIARPDLVKRLVFVGGVFHYEGWRPGVIDATKPPPPFMARLYGEVSPDGIDHYPVVVEKLARMHELEPALTIEQLGRVACRTLVMLGDDDEVELEHALQLYRAVREAELAVVPGASHGLLVEKAELCNRIIVDFLANDPTETLAPIRRRAR